MPDVLLPVLNPHGGAAHVVERGPQGVLQLVEVLAEAQALHALPVACGRPAGQEVPAAAFPALVERVKLLGRVHGERERGARVKGAAA